MKPSRFLLAVTLASAFGAVGAEALPESESRYVQRINGRFATFAGSRANLESLAVGLRRGTQINLGGRGESATVLPPTRPMGYGNVTRALELASRNLAAIGITRPTPTQIRAALNGGTVSTATGEVPLQGVLRLRSQGMGWGQVAHRIGVHPGQGSATAARVPAAATTRMTTAAGGDAAWPGRSAGHDQRPAQAAPRGAGITSAAGSTSRSPAAGPHSTKAQPSFHAGGKGGGRI